jgi:hypothetical protein
MRSNSSSAGPVTSFAVDLLFLELELRNINWLDLMSACRMRPRGGARSSLAGTLRAADGVRPGPAGYIRRLVIPGRLRGRVWNPWTRFSPKLMQACVHGFRARRRAAPRKTRCFDIFLPASGSVRRRGARPGNFLPCDWVLEHKLALAATVTILPG